MWELKEAGSKREHVLQKCVTSFMLPRRELGFEARLGFLFSGKLFKMTAHNVYSSWSIWNCLFRFVPDQLPAVYFLGRQVPGYLNPKPCTLNPKPVVCQLRALRLLPLWEVRRAEGAREGGVLHLEPAGAGARRLRGPFGGVAQQGLFSGCPPDPKP